MSLFFVALQKAVRVEGNLQSFVISAVDEEDC